MTGLDLGRVWYVIAEPHQDPARVVAGPISDADEARGRADFEPFPATIMNGVWLVHNVQDNDYNVEWSDEAERPAALAEAR